MGIYERILDGKRSPESLLVEALLPLLDSRHQFHRRHLAHVEILQFVEHGFHLRVEVGTRRLLADLSGTIVGLDLPLARVLSVADELAELTVEDGLSRSPPTPYERLVSHERVRRRSCHRRRVDGDVT